MGQAKRRGTKEERVKQAMVRQTEEANRQLAIVESENPTSTDSNERFQQKRGRALRLLACATALAAFR